MIFNIISNFIVIVKCLKKEGNASNPSFIVTIGLTIYGTKKIFFSAYVLYNITIKMSRFICKFVK